MAWFLLVSLSIVLVRMPFRGVDIVPGAVEFFPGIVLIPAAGIYCGPAGVLGVAAGAVVSDALFGTWGLGAWVRAAAFALGAMGAARLGSRVRASEPDRPPPRDRRLGAFVLVGCAAGSSVAAWQGLAGAWAGLYPFAYLAALHLANHLLFICLFAPLAVHVAETEWVPAVGDWRTVLGDDAATANDLPRWSLALLWTGGAAACLYGFLASGWIDGVWPTERATIGARTSLWVTVPAACILLLQAAALLSVAKPAPEASAGPAKSAARFRGLFLSPIKKM